MVNTFVFVGTVRARRSAHDGLLKNRCEKSESLLVYTRSCWTLPAVEIVIDCLVVDFHESQSSVKCSRSVEKSYIIMTASNLLDRTLTPKTDRSRSEGSNPLVKLIRGRMGSVSESDPTD